MKLVIVFLCTPRCGTQWLAKNLGEIYSDTAVVEHEPVGCEYHLKKNLGVYDSLNDLYENEVYRKHEEYIDEVTKSKTYIEIGWPSIAGIPELYRKYGKRLRLIHLYRNPVNVAASLVTHDWYTGKVKKRYENLELTPFDPSASLVEYKNRWADITLFEKSLYYWTEINLRALEINQHYPRIPTLSFKFEDLFTENERKRRSTLINLLLFMGLKYDEKMHEAIDIKHDNYHYRSSFPIHWKKIFEHPDALQLAFQLGYTFENELNLKRYKQKPLYVRILDRLNAIFNKNFKGYEPKFGK